MHCRNAFAAAIAVLAVCAIPAGLAPVWAQTAAAVSRPSIAAARIDAADAPAIDADLSDPAWARAAVLDDFRQVVPDTGAPATERTVVRIMYDENNLYFGVYAYDSEPDLIVVRTMARDGEIYTGDNVSIALDPGPTRRNAYSFQFGPSGGRNDSLMLNNTEELDEWNPIWTLRTRIVSDGWVAEMAIPFQSLSYEAGETDWGFEVARSIRRKNEDVQWAVQNPAMEFTDVSQAGTLTGISNVNQGLGLDVQVYGVLRAKHDWHVPGDGAGISGTAGGNAFYKLTPAFTGTLTFNPDFSDAPLDVRQINRTRFSLFTPETRNFFLQDASAFEFAGRNFTRSIGFAPDRGANNGRPFFSRNIGLVRGVPVSIVAGGKLSGTYQGFGIGALSVLTGDTPAASGQVLTVARVTRPLFAESKIGMAVTNGDPTGATENTVAGADFQYRDSDLSGAGVFTADMFYQRSFSDADGEDHSFGAALNFPNEPWGADFSFKQIGKDFSPALGFLNRPGIRSYDGSLRHVTRYRDYFLRTLQFSTPHSLVTGLGGRLETRSSEAEATAELLSGDEFSLSVQDNFEAVPDAFPLPGAIEVPQGRYRWTNVGAQLESSDRRALAASAEITCCSFYDGDAIELQFNVSYRPGANFELGGGWEIAMYDMPGGSADIHVLDATGTVNFTPDMQLVFQAQWDNDSKDFGFLARYRWEFVPGDELFVSFGQAALVDGGRFTAQRSQFALRVGHTFRY